MERAPLDSPVTLDPWTPLRSTTSARIALGRAGGSLPTHEWLNFKAAHVDARDAVHSPFDAERLANEVAQFDLGVANVTTAATDRRMFLERPDLGRRLDESSQYALQQLRCESEFDLAIIASDGLSAVAANRQVCPLLAELLPKLKREGWRLAPIVIAKFGRVALQDQIGQLLGAQLVLMLIGERPGLGSPDSLGAYLVCEPQKNNTDANRNCVSNIRPEGLPYDTSAETIFYLLNEARRRGMSGVRLKDERPPMRDEINSTNAIAAVRAHDQSI
ncbi:MAG TPA: ethanolamine ammonia-lyase subunit EutC [Lacipirellulaceae bacterium]|nr:ethanolamine ammonia-lyase subunit EutC [Lacipirellulaceae bacterium]